MKPSIDVALRTKAEKDGVTVSLAKTNFGCSLEIKPVELTDVLRWLYATNLPSLARSLYYVDLRTNKIDILKKFGIQPFKVLSPTEVILDIFRLSDLNNAVHLDASLIVACEEKDINDIRMTVAKGNSPLSVSTTVELACEVIYNLGIIHNRKNNSLNIVANYIANIISNKIGQTVPPIPLNLLSEYVKREGGIELRSYSFRYSDDDVMIQSLDLIYSIDTFQWMKGWLIN